jgi:Co/Zn/Cd efflux system component
VNFLRRHPLNHQNESDQGRHMLQNERVALALIALITGTMGFIESMIAVPAGSTAMAADALSFVQHSITAGFSLWATAGTIHRQRWTVQLQGFVMALLGGLVCLIAVRRLYFGSLPHPVAMTIIGIIALIADLAVGAIVLGQRRMLTGIGALWRISRTDCVGNIAVIAAAAAVFATRSNIPDIVIGGAMAMYFFIFSWRIAITGRLDAGRTPSSE